MLPDDRHDDGAPRMAVTGYIGMRLHLAVFVDRLDERRVVSLRKATAREERRHAEA